MTATGASTSPSGREGRDTVFVYVGTYTGEQSRGIYRFEMDLHSGAATAAELAAETPNPSYLTISPDGNFLFATNEIGDFAGGNGGAISSFAIERGSGRLSPVNQQPSGGAGPCHIRITANGRHVLVANYTAGNVAVLPVDGKGQLGTLSAVVQHHGASVDPVRQTGPHAHSINPDPSGRFALACDLGLDKILIYGLDPVDGKLNTHEPASATAVPGSGPRHLSFHPTGRWAYVVNEMASTVTAFAFDREQGSLKEMQTLSALPADYAGDNTGAEIVVHPSGQFLYVSNRGHDSLALFRIDAGSGQLTPVGHESTRGKTPRGFSIDPSGKFLIAANQESGNLAVFRIEQETGHLSPVTMVEPVGQPVAVVFLRP